MKVLNKETVGCLLNHKEALNFYLKPFHDKPYLNGEEFIRNPFLDTPQTPPTFHIYKTNENNWKFRDSSRGDEGDIFDLVQKINECNLSDALKTILQDLNLSLAFQEVHKKYGFKTQKSIPKNQLDYWNSFGITEEVLDHYDILSLESITIGDPNNRPILCDFAVVYPVNSKCHKLYQPLESKTKYRWLGKMGDSDFIFGKKQLEWAGTTLYIVEGEKDVLTLASQGFDAISLSSITSSISDSNVRTLQRRFPKMVVLYSLDETSQAASKKLADQHGFNRLILPDELKQKGGSDVSDLFKFGFNLEHPDIISVEPEKSVSVVTEGVFLQKLLTTQALLTSKKASNISAPEAILSLNGNEVIFPCTINIIQGKAGVHKSRLAETITSAFIAKPQTPNLLGFKRSSGQDLTVCYVDTERNLSFQFPYALQQVLKKARYSREETPPNLDYISLLEISRAERFSALNEYLQHVRIKYKGHVVVVLDVVTDCILDFNRSSDSMQLIDLMNLAINQQDVTFICLIHENPGSADKARGHLGTELMNKSSTAIQVEFEKGEGNQPSDLISLNFLKCRSTRKHDSIYLAYSQEHNGLVLADPDLVSETAHSRQLKAPLDEVKSYIFDYLEDGPAKGSDLIDGLKQEFACSDKVIRNRLKELVECETVIKTTNDSFYYLFKEMISKENWYSLKLR